MAEPTTTMIESTRAGSTTVLRMTHGKANALDTEFLRALREAFATEARSDARAIVLTGNGSIFSAGVDLVRLIEGGRAYLEEFLPELSAAFCELFAFAKPAVAAVNGHAIAGGCILTCACDRRLMAAGTGRIGVPELKVGVPFPLSALEIMRFALPPHIAQEAVLLGKAYTPEEARDRGIIDEVVDSGRLMTDALAVAEELGSIDPGSFRRAKQDLRRLVLETWARHATAHDRETLEAWSSGAVQSAVRAYVEKTLRRKG